MYIDLYGRRRLKVGLHTHTTLSDGRKPPEEAAAVYRAAGYDAIAITDHWVYHAGGEIGGLTILSGCEYNICGLNTDSGAVEHYHIVGVGMTREPSVPRDYMVGGGTVADGYIRHMVRTLVRAIREAGGLAVLAHPAWSVNTPEQIVDCWDFDATEIYNSVSDFGESDRPYSGVIVDQLAAHYGKYLPLLATDDTHAYAGDECRGFVMVEADAVEELGMVEALRQGHFYATQGPEVHLERLSDTAVRVVCTPAVKIVLDSNLPWSVGHVLRGEGLTEHTYSQSPSETYVRAEVTDAEGRVGYSNIVVL